MGLDISYYDSYTKVDSDGIDTDDLWDAGYIKLHHTEPTLSQSDGLSGWVNASYIDSFRAGSYGGYSQWRSRLSVLIHGVEPDYIWNNLEAWAGKPFIELINFSDCEGFIGPETSAKLAKDFEDYQEIINSAHMVGVYRGDDYWLGLYNTWKVAFQTASHGGFVHFH